MRLSAYEIETFIEVVKKFLGNYSAELRLYGSRVDDSKKGGDIDLLLLMNDKTNELLFIKNKYNILGNFAEILGEQKIDLTICCIADLEADPFLKIIYPQSILLHKYS